MSILFAFLSFVVIVVFLIEYRERKKKSQGNLNSQQNVQEPIEEKVNGNVNGNRPLNCCGAHLICEKELEINPITEIVYYDDEELDDYKGIHSDQYSEQQVQQFSEVFYTLKENDVSGWLRSLQVRGIELPDQLKDEALMIVRELRK